jgi:hypothetical protein
MTAGAASADIRLGRFDNWIGPERLIMDTVGWYAEWNGSLTPDYNAAAVREATIEYNEIKRAQGKSGSSFRCRAWRRSRTQSDIFVAQARLCMKGAGDVANSYSNHARARVTRRRTPRGHGGGVRPERAAIHHDLSSAIMTAKMRAPAQSAAAATSTGHDALGSPRENPMTWRR